MNWSHVDLMLLVSMLLTVLVWHVQPRAHAARGLALAGLVLPHWCALRCGVPPVAEWGMTAGLYLAALIFPKIGLHRRRTLQAGERRLIGTSWLIRFRRVDRGHLGNWRGGMPGLLAIVSAIGLGLCAKWLVLLFHGAPAGWLARFSLFDIMAEGLLLLAGIVLPPAAARMAGNWFRCSRHPVWWSLLCLIPLLGGGMLAVAAGWFAPLLVRSDLLYRFAPMLPLSGIWLMAGSCADFLKARLWDGELPGGAVTTDDDNHERITGDLGLCASVESQVTDRVRPYPGHCWRRVVPLLSLSLAAMCLALFLMRPFGATPPAYPVGEEMWIAVGNGMSGKDEHAGKDAPQRMLCLSANRHGLLAVQGWQVVWIPWLRIESLDPLNRYGQAPLAGMRRW